MRQPNAVEPIDQDPAWLLVGWLRTFGRECATPSVLTGGDLRAILRARPVAD
jgi:hypothetical protein